MKIRMRLHNDSSPRLVNPITVPKRSISLLHIPFLMKTLILVFVFSVIFSFSHVSGYNYTTPNFPNYRLCFGIEDPVGFNPTNPASSYNFVRKTYAGCTHITRSVVLNNIEGNVDLSFLNSIIDIGGTLVIVNLRNVPLISFQNLTVIRGAVPFVYDSEPNGTYYSLVISNNRISNGQQGIINLGALSSVMEHGILVKENTGYCNMQSVLWSNFPETTSQEVNVTIAPCDQTPTCASSCPVVSGKRHCYGPEPSMCQRVYCNRSTCEWGRCYPNTIGATCCHPYCVGGCTAHASDKCFACKKFKNGNECTEICPRRTLYNRLTMTLSDNPNYLLAFVGLCVKQCPPRFLEGEIGCLAHCADGWDQYPGFGNKCVSCRPNCRKGCHHKVLKKALMARKGEAIKRTYLYDVRTQSFTYTPRSVLKGIANCTIYDGDIRINLLSNRPVGNLDEHVRVEDFENLSNLEHLNGELYLLLNRYPTVKNLQFLSKLKSIRSIRQHGFFIMSPHLEYLGLRQLTNINVNSAQIVKSPKLCYMENFNQRFNGSVTTIGLKPAANCTQEGKVCDSHCLSQGCWGPGRRMCVQ